MSDVAIHDPVFVVVPAGEVNEHDPLSSARVRLPHALPVEDERGPDRPGWGRTAFPGMVIQSFSDIVTTDSVTNYLLLQLSPTREVQKSNFIL